MQHSHCSYCGTAYRPDTPWPRRCPGCGETTWRNPLPVAVALLPVTPSAPAGQAGTGQADTVQAGTGLVVVRRDIEPARGELALPGGFMEIGESWREAVVRELHEETGIDVDAAEVTLFDVHSASHTVNVFGLLPARRADTLPRSAPRAEVSEWLVINGPRQLAFPTHTAAVADFFAAAARTAST